MKNIKIIPLILALTLTIAIPSAQALTASGTEHDTTFIKNLVNATQLTDVKQVILTLDPIILNVPADFTIKLNLDTYTRTIFQYNRAYFLWQGTEFDENGLYKYNIYPRITTSIVYTSPTTIQITTYLNREIFGFPDQIMFKTNATVPDNDPIISLTYSSPRQGYKDVTWQLETSQTNIALDIDVNQQTFKEYVISLFSQIGALVTLYIQIVNAITTVIIYAPPFIAFIIADAIMTALIQGDWKPIGAITTAMFNLLVFTGQTIASIIGAIVPW